VLVGVAAMGLNVVLSLTLPGVFARAGWMPHGGLALSNSIATFLEMLVLLFLMRRRLGGLEEPRLLAGLGQAAIASAAMLAVLWLWQGMVQAAPVWAQAAGGIALGLLAYALAAALLRVPEVGMLAGLVRVQLSKRLGR
jgi:putative peptidoglycan lipid II flippase